MTRENEFEDTTAAVLMVDKYGEKESSVPELCSLESVCGQACVYRHIARCVFTTIFINHKYSCSGVFKFILPRFIVLLLVVVVVCTFACTIKKKHFAVG